MGPMRGGPAWDGWFHVCTHTYGTWLPGDPRGFRTRHHRQHVDGDYRNPPPAGTYNGLHRRSKSLLRRDPVFLTWEQRTRAVAEVVRSLAKWNVPLAALSIDRVHKHALVQCIDHAGRGAVVFLDDLPGFDPSCLLID